MKNGNSKHGNCVFYIFCSLTAKRPRILPDLKSKNLLVRVSLQNSIKSGKSTSNPFLPPFHSLYTKSNPTVTCAILRNIGSQNSGSKWLNPAMFPVGQNDAGSVKMTRCSPPWSSLSRGQTVQRCQDTSQSSEIYRKIIERQPKSHLKFIWKSCKRNWNII